MTISRNLIAALLCAVGGFMFFAFMWPEYRYANAVQQALDDRSQLIRDSGDALGNMQILNGEYEVNRAKYDRMSVFMPKNERSDYITASLQNAAAQTGVQLSSISITGAKDASGRQTVNYLETQVTLKISGSYVNILRFLGAIEKNLRLYDVIQLGLSKDTTAYAVQVQGDIQLITYSLNTK